MHDPLLAYCFIAAGPGSDYPPIFDLPLRSRPARSQIDRSGKGGPRHLKTRSWWITATFPALGYRIGNAAYTPDLNDIPRESWGALEGLDLWIVDGLRYTPHPSHFSIDDALSWIERFKPKRAVITNMTADVDYEVIRQKLPAGVVPAYDGLRLETH